MSRFDENLGKIQDVFDLLKLLKNLRDEMSVKFHDFRKYQKIMLFAITEM